MNSGTLNNQRSWMRSFDDVAMQQNCSLRGKCSPKWRDGRDSGILPAKICFSLEKRGLTFKSIGSETVLGPNVHSRIGFCVWRSRNSLGTRTELRKISKCRFRNWNRVRSVMPSLQLVEESREQEWTNNKPGWEDRKNLFSFVRRSSRLREQNRWGRFRSFGCTFWIQESKQSAFDVSNMHAIILHQGMRNRNNQPKDLGFLENLKSNFEAEKDHERAEIFLHFLKHFRQT